MRLYLVTIVLLFAVCEGAFWHRNKDVTASLKPGNAESAGLEASNTDSSSTESPSTIASDASSTTIVPPKTFGCTPLLWADTSFCWTRCNNASTSNMFNTWCFTTELKTDISEKVECTNDDTCKENWPCQSSCGMFSPHWDRKKNDEDESKKKNQTVTLTQTESSFSLP